MSFGLQKALEYIKNVSSVSEQHDLSCLEMIICLETEREVVIRLKMLEWGLFGLGEASAGLFLAYHYSKLGPYFGDLNGNEWPHFPLYENPSELEKTFDQILMNLTNIISNYKLMNTSLIDLPAFGSKIVNLKKDQKKEPNWPTEINFALWRNNDTTSDVFVQYKILLEQWASHMDTLYKNDKSNSFTNDMKSNTYFNFTSHIMVDMKAFLSVIAGIYSILLLAYRSGYCTRKYIFFLVISKICTTLLIFKMPCNREILNVYEKYFSKLYVITITIELTFIIKK